MTGQEAIDALRAKVGQTDSIGPDYHATTLQSVFDDGNKRIASNKSLIDQTVEVVNEHAESIDGLNAKVSANETAISGLGVTTDDLKTATESNKAAAAAAQKKADTNAESIAATDKKADANTLAAKAAQEKADANDLAIKALSTDLSALDGEVDTNTSAIAAQAVTIEKNTAAAKAAQDKADTNEAAITEQGKAVAANTEGVGANSKGLASLKSTVESMSVTLVDGVAAGSNVILKAGEGLQFIMDESTDPVSVTIAVHIPLKFVIPPRLNDVDAGIKKHDLNVSSGTTVELECATIGGAGKLTYFFYKNGSCISSTSDDHHSLGAVHANDGGEFYIKVKDSDGCEISNHDNQNTLTIT